MGNSPLRKGALIDGAGTTPIPIKSGNSDQNSDHGEFEPPELKSTVNLERKGNSDHGPSFLPGETQTMVRVHCQNGDGGGSWVGELRGSGKLTRFLCARARARVCVCVCVCVCVGVAYQASSPSFCSSSACVGITWTCHRGHLGP